MCVPVPAFSLASCLVFGELNHTTIENHTQRYKCVSENSGTPKSSILIGFSIINHPFWGTPIFGNTHKCVSFLPILQGNNKSSWWTISRRITFFCDGGYDYKGIPPKNARKAQVGKEFIIIVLWPRFNRHHQDDDITFVPVRFVNPKQNGLAFQLLLAFTSSSSLSRWWQLKCF